MKALWSAVSFMAVVHLLAMGLFVGWLWQSERLDVDRVREIRDMLKLTIAEQEEADAEAQAAADAEAAAAADEARRQDPPASTAETLAYVSRIRAEEQQAKRRLGDDKRALEAELNRRARLLDLREQELDARDLAWREANAEELKRRTDEQFLKTVKLYSTVPAKQAKQMLVALVADGQTDQAVAYVNAMNSRIAAKVISELKAADEVVLATELLEELRTFGLPPEATEESSDDNALADADQSG